MSQLISSKRGKLYLKFFLAAATPAIVNTNTTALNGVPVANAYSGGDAL